MSAPPKRPVSISGHLLILPLPPGQPLACFSISLAVLDASHKRSHTALGLLCLLRTLHVTSEGFLVGGASRDFVPLRRQDTAVSPSAAAPLLLTWLCEPRLCEHSCTVFCVDALSFLLVTYLGMEVLGPVAILCLIPRSLTVFQNSCTVLHSCQQ